MSFLTRMRHGPRQRVAPPVGDDADATPPDGTAQEARVPVWPLLVLVAGALLSGFWVLALLWGAYLGLLWLVGTG